MVTTKLNIGKIPISKGEYQEGTTYQRLNQVTMLGSTYQSKIDDNTSAPAQMGAGGAVENINTDKWLCIAVGNVSAARKVVYNNETSGLEAENVQEAIDEVGSKVSDLTDSLTDSLTPLAIPQSLTPSEVVNNQFISENGDTVSNNLYTLRKYSVKAGEGYKLVGANTGVQNMAIYAFYSSSDLSSSTLVRIVLMREVLGEVYSGAKQATLDKYIIIPEGVTCVATISTTSVKNDLLLYKIADSKKYIDESIKQAQSKTETKFVDCLGDSLTMGATRFGWYETTMQELLGDAYAVRNWGVGGETSASIMVRQGSDCVKFQTDWILNADGSATIVADTENNNLFIKTQSYDTKVNLLLQGAENDLEQKERVVNPCYINGIECTMSYIQDSAYGKGKWYIKRNSLGDRNITIPANTPVYFNTGKEMGKSEITIIWMGANDGTYSDWQTLVDKQVMAANKVFNKKFVVIGLHKIGKTNGEAYESLMRKAFGNKFFNIREYMCTNMIYDAGITPTEDDLSKMAAGDCPTSLLYDGTHLKPASNVALGKMLYSICVGLGYV